jgi:hypothetical protein
MFAFTLLALVAVANAQFPNLSNLFPNGGNNGGSPQSPGGGPTTGGANGNGGLQLDSNILANLGKLLQGLNGGSGAGGASVDANGQFSFANIQDFLNNAGVKLNGATDSLKSALSNIKLPELNFQGAELKDVQSLLNQFDGLKLLNGKLTAPSSVDLNGNLVTASPVEIDSFFKVLQGKVLQTVNALVVKANASLATDPNASISAAVTQFLGGNADFTKGNFTTGLLLFNEAKTKILGNFQVVGDHLAQIAADAKLQLGNQPADPNAPNPIAQILAKFNVSGDLSIDGPTNLLGLIGGNGNVTIKSLLDLSAANNLGGALDSETLIKAKTLILDNLADLKLKVQANSGILANITQSLNFGNGKIDISIPDDVKQTVLKFLHGSSTGKAQITIDGKSVVDVTSGAPTGAVPANTADANGNVWTVNYGEKETTLELKNEKEVYAATTGVIVDTHSGVASTTIAVAAVVAAIAVLN